jgi:Sel1 repeat
VKISPPSVPTTLARFGKTVAVAGATFALALAITAADASAPVLLSRTGGGGWADLKELQAAVAKGNPKAEAALGEMLLRGEGLAKDEPRGVALLEKAARAGNSAAAFRIGMLLSDGEAGVTQDLGRALAYFRAAAAGGEAEAFFNIGAAYGSARGVKRDYAEALAWLTVAKQRGAGVNEEASLRARIQSRTAWIATAERRAREIVQELEGKTVVSLLPAPAPLTPAAPSAKAP